jgi:hypothetical protein
MRKPMSPSKQGSKSKSVAINGRLKLKCGSVKEK